MAQLLIRKVDDNIVSTLKRRAQECGTSLEEEARRSLDRDAGFDRERWLAEAAAFRKRIGRLPGPDSTELLRQDRARDDFA